MSVEEGLGKRVIVGGSVVIDSARTRLDEEGVASRTLSIIVKALRSPSTTDVTAAAVAIE